ncbi:MAG: hypothetical protein Q8P20_04690 [bacterium]|nr:hypothetical protein [bacterium]
MIKKIGDNGLKFKLPKRKKGKAKISLQFILLFLLIISGIIGWGNARGAISVIDKKEAAVKEAARPANLEITTITDQSCTDCSSLNGFIEYIKSQNAKVVKETYLDIKEEEAQSMISDYNIDTIPFIMVSGELDKDAELAKIWPAWGSVQNNLFIQTNFIPPFIDLATNKVNGLVDITYITDDSCEECFDVKKNKNVLENNYGVKIVREDTFDISSKEGKEFKEKYNITKLPTFFINNEAANYSGLLNVWKNVGTIESDGIYLFRSVEQLGVYHNLENNEVVDPASQENTDQSTNK